MKKGFVIHHNGPPAECVGKSHSRCESFWRAVENYHVGTKGWSGIAYSFGVCPHGTRFTGQGWNRNQFANGADVVGPDDGEDRYWYTVLVFLGGDEKPTPEMVDSTRALIDEGRAWGRCLDRVLPHNAFKSKACPGPEFTAYAKAWDNQPLTSEEDVMTPEQFDHFHKLIIERTGLVYNYVGQRTGMIYNAVKGGEVDEVEVARLVLEGIGDAELSSAQVQSIVDAIPPAVKKALREGTG